MGEECIITERFDCPHKILSGKICSACKIPDERKPAPMIEEIKELLDDYYGESRNDDQKQKIAEFIKNYSLELEQIFAANAFE